MRIELMGKGEKSYYYTDALSLDKVYLHLPAHPTILKSHVPSTFPSPG